MRMIKAGGCRWLALVGWLGCLHSSIFGQKVGFSDKEWKLGQEATVRHEIRGTGERNNPLRRELAEPFSGEELFVRYRIRYEAESVDLPEEGDGEFFVLWVDGREGVLSDTHSNGVPNIGLHVDGGLNKFMVRFHSGSGEAYAAELKGGDETLLVGRLWKSEQGKAFDRLSLWVNPEGGELGKPAATAMASKGIREIRWIGFSTGRKTEPDDRIVVWDVGLATSWQGILGLPEVLAEPVVEEVVVPPREVDFAGEVLPVLEQKCFKCHEGDGAKKGIRLDVLDEVLNLTAPRNHKGSQLYEVVAHGEMPPEGKGEPLTESELEVFRAWIDWGLVWDEKLLPTPVPESDHWAFQPIQRPYVPKVNRQEWVRTPVDAFIARKHEELGLEPAPEAGEAILQRRMSLDLLGLPPKPGKVLSVDELLADPAYGERWGRHWLDVARWAESNGHQHNRERPNAWRYRDYVVDAFQSDKPFERFILEQLAGDELEPTTSANIVATGFLSAARYSGNELDKDIQRNDILADVANTTGPAFLGLTMECAQCHTHKFDPITIRDYYRFQAFFARGQPGNVVLPEAARGSQPLIEERWKIFDTVHDRLVENRRKRGYPEPILVIPKSVIGSMRGQEKARFEELETQLKKLPQTWGYWSGQDWYVAPHTMRWPLSDDRKQLATRKTHLLIRGDVKSPGPEVRPGWPSVFGNSPEVLAKPRTALAKWMAQPENPLVARVWVNRVWQWHFGRGLVETSGDFGTQGTPPTHPELLDYLASELMEKGWSTSHIHKLILNSATYRQSSRLSEGNVEADPGNHAYWRWEPRRLEAEAVRDSILAVAGILDLKRGGPSVAAGTKRRSLYLKQIRDRLPGQQMLFDSANGNTSCSRRRVSTNALQPLWLMNSSLVQEASFKLAGRAGSLEKAFGLVLNREPEEGELTGLRQLTHKHGLASACKVLLNSSEFLYIP